VIVTCSLCGATYREDDPDVRPAYGEWTCTDESGCEASHGI
jgi:hypothetical protein